VPTAAQPAVKPDVAAEAALWVARLHGPSRSPQMERDCLAWQARSAEHRLAFERCTEVWQEVPGVTLGDAYAARKSANEVDADARARRGRRHWAVALSVGVIAVAAVAFQYWQGRGAYSTGVGEQQMVLLDDGTRMSLNTATRVRVRLGSSQRRVSVEAGEALFEVAKDARRPFVVQAAGSEVVALGTVFSVRLAPEGSAGHALAVTLIEGHVTVSPVEGGGAASARPESRLLLQPGERARLQETADGKLVAQPAVDRPHIDQVVAWTRGEAVFDGASLADAVAEMNRYSRAPIVLGSGLAAARLKISGQFRTGDNLAFANAVATLHGLTVRQQADRIELARGS